MRVAAGGIMGTMGGVSRVVGVVGAGSGRYGRFLAVGWELGAVGEGKVP